jgi:hypothetical protein
VLGSEGLKGLGYFDPEVGGLAFELLDHGIIRDDKDGLGAARVLGDGLKLFELGFHGQALGLSVQVGGVHAHDLAGGDLPLLLKPDDSGLDPVVLQRHG